MNYIAPRRAHGALAGAAFTRTLFALVLGVASLALSREARAQWTPENGLVLKGTIVTMDDKDTVIPNGEILVQGGKIVAMGATVDHGNAIVIDTKGVIFPSLMNLHNHTAYNIEPLYPIGKKFTNRNQWPSGDAYTSLVKNAKNAMATDKVVDESIKYAEIMQIMGGVTVVQGSPVDRGNEDVIIRNTESNFEDNQEGEDVIGPDLRNANDTYRTKIAKLDGFFFHLAEGVDDTIRSEYEQMKQILMSVDCTECACEVFNPKAPQGQKPDGACWTMLNGHRCGHSQAQHVLLSAPTTLHPHAVGQQAWFKLIGIHCTGLKDADFADWQTITKSSGVGPKIVWSPTSNLMLYEGGTPNNTTDIPTAMAHDALVSLGTDWTPSGNKNLLWELKFADQVNQSAFKGKLSSTDLVALVTRNPAKLLGWDHLGSLKVGQTADLVVVDSSGGKDPYRSLIDATEKNVQLVTIGGDPRYGDESWLKLLKLNPDKSPRYELLTKESPAGRMKALDLKRDPKQVPKGDETLQQIEDKIDQALADQKVATKRTGLNESTDVDFWNYWTKGAADGGNINVKDGVLGGLVDVKAMAQKYLDPAVFNQLHWPTTAAAEKPNTGMIQAVDESVTAAKPSKDAPAADPKPAPADPKADPRPNGGDEPRD